MNGIQTFLFSGAVLTLSTFTVAFSRTAVYADAQAGNSGTGEWQICPHRGAAVSIKEPLLFNAAKLPEIPRASFLNSHLSRVRPPRYRFSRAFQIGFPGLRRGPVDQCSPLSDPDTNQQ